VRVHVERPPASDFEGSAPIGKGASAGGFGEVVEGVDHVVAWIRSAKRRTVATDNCGLEPEMKDVAFSLIG